jgi:hypothetical protein
MLKRGLVILVVVLIVLAIIGLLLPRTAATLNQSVAGDIEGGAPPSGACAGERRLAQQMLGGPADAIVLDGGAEFEAHSHRLGYRG